MSSFGKQTIKGKNCNTLEPNPDGSINVVSTSSPGAGTPNIYEFKKLQTSGGIVGMNVDGSTTPVIFEFKPGAGEIFDLQMLTLLMIDPGSMDTTDFGSILKLPTGFLLEMKVNGTGPHTTALLKDNGDIATHFQSLPSISGNENRGFLDEQDQFRGMMLFDVDPVPLFGDKGDFIRWTVQDDLTKLKELRSSVRLLKTV